MRGHSVADTRCRPQCQCHSLWPSVGGQVSVSATVAECQWTQCQCQPLWQSVGGHSVSATRCGRVSVDTVSVPLIVSECHRTQCPYNMGVRHWVSSTVSVSATVAECRWIKCQCHLLWPSVGGHSVSVSHCGRVSVDTVSVPLILSECQWTKCQCLAQTRIYGYNTKLFPSILSPQLWGESNYVWADATQDHWKVACVLVILGTGVMAVKGAFSWRDCSRAVQNNKNGLDLLDEKEDESFDADEQSKTIRTWIIEKRHKLGRT
ncbi:uncharacterized protein LOC118435693 isoform X1 [Folsomia candida]|uniref:uncharacterized protein LOC118435693 isoform X1 n=1 Tax=Folsomia candida TaxID=158441 RepID=UPI0016050F37|nr:uncharacterized protein LOC118435693 isoform X1 [Folsomia candida]